MRHRVYSFIAVVALAVVIAPTAARGDIITPMFFDGFEADTADVLDASLSKWNITSGSVDVLSAGNLCGPSGNYSNCVDLDGTGATAGTMATKTTFSLQEGTYLLSFDLAGANRKWPGSTGNTVTVSLGSYYSQAFSPNQYDPFQTYSALIVVDNPGNAKIGFNHNGSDWIGLLLDNVSLSHVVIEDEVIPTPEHGAWELGIAMLGLAAWRFRKTLEMARG
jgi:hypothetical protein